MLNLLNRLLRSRAFYVLATGALTYIFWWSGLTKLLDWPGAVAEMQHFGLKPAAFFAALTIGVQLVGSALIVSGSRWAWLGAGALATFTLGTIPLAHRFWEMDGMVAMLEKALVQDHISVIGGLAVAAALAHLRQPGMDRR